MSENLFPHEKIKREILVRKEAETSSKYGCKPEDRPTAEIIKYGIVNIDKPKGPTSHQVSAFVQDILGLKKAGHSGTLDPGVTGVLPIALGDATKMSQFLLTAGKEYVANMHLHKEIDEKTVRKVLKQKFIGKIKQMPPIKSAVKRQWRYRKIYYLDITEIEGQDILFRVGTQAGTYIRKYIHDIGQELGCGAHMSELRRTRAGPFNEETLCTLQDLKDAYHYWKEENEKPLQKLIQPVENAVKHLPKIWVNDSAVNSLCHGMDLKVPGIVKLETEIQKEDLVSLMTLKDELIAVAKAEIISKDMLEKQKGKATTMERVFMNPDLYPKIK
ncbi:RNA-guided pseudouridylation complex pseudouridine synthase subunit Cbf5 [Nanoarchaeota archaeon]